MHTVEESPSSMIKKVFLTPALLTSQSNRVNLVKTTETSQSSQSLGKTSAKWSTLQSQNSKRENWTIQRQKAGFITIFFYIKNYFSSFSSELPRSDTDESSTFYDSLTLSLPDSQQTGPSQTSNWSTQSENASLVLQIKNREKLVDIAKFKQVFQDVACSFPDSLSVGLNLKVSFKKKSSGKYC